MKFYSLSKQVRFPRKGKDGCGGGSKDALRGALLNVIV